MKFMKIARLYAGKDGESHFDAVEASLDAASGDMRLPELTRVAGIFVRDNSKGSPTPDYHPVSRRQYGVILNGEIEIEVGDGSKRRFGPGEMFLAEDTTGRGHKSRAVGGKNRECLFITLE